MSDSERPFTALDAYFRSVACNPLCDSEPRLMPLFELAVGRGLVRDGVTIDVDLGPPRHRTILHPTDSVPNGSRCMALLPNVVSAKVSHVFDWLVAALKDDDAWLSRTDHLGRPSKLLKIGSVDRAVREADKAMRRKLAAMADTVLVEGGEEIHAELGDGWRMVRLLTPEALDLESVRMQHCVGQGGYDEHLSSGRRLYLSLRDPAGNPHATLEIDPEERRLLEFQGKQNRRPLSKYGRVARNWLRRTIRLDNERSRGNEHTWWSGVVVDAYRTMHEADALPDRLDVHGFLSLDVDEGHAVPSERLSSTGGIVEISGEGECRLPRLVRATTLRVSGSGPSFPEGAIVDVAHLELYGCRVERLPTDIGGFRIVIVDRGCVGELPRRSDAETFVLSDASVGRIPADTAYENLKVFATSIGSIGEGPTFGELELSDARIGTLPPRTRILKELSVGVTDMGRLPDDVAIEGDLILDKAGAPDGTPIVLPGGLRIGGRLKIRSWEGGVLPDGTSVGLSAELERYGGSLPARLSVGGNLTVDGSRVKHLPSDLSVGGDLYYKVDDGLPTIGEGATIGGRILVVWDDGERDRVDEVPRSDLTVVPDADAAPSP